MIGITRGTASVEQSFARGWYVHLRDGVHWIVIAHTGTKREALKVRGKFNRLIRQLRRETQ